MKRKNGKGSSWIRKNRRLAIYLRDKFHCLYCDRDLHGANPREITLDHLVSQSVKKNHNSENLVTACLSCNSRKAALPLRLFATSEALERIRRSIRRKVNLKLANQLLKGK